MRPKSAKPGNKYQQKDFDDDSRASKEDFLLKQQLKTESNKTKSRLYSANAQYKKNLNITRPIELSNGQFTRIMPKNIYQDKERLYSEALMLKHNMHGILDENIKLKTKIAILEKQKERLSKMCDLDYHSKNKLNSTSNFNAQQANTVVTGLKKILRESREEIELLKVQNKKIKKTVKYTKISEIQIENKNITQQNKRLTNMLGGLIEKQQQQINYQTHIEELQTYLKAKIEENQKLISHNNRYADEINRLEEALKNSQMKFQDKEDKLSKDLSITKRRLQDKQKENEFLKTQLSKLRQEKAKTPKPREKVVINNIINTNSNIVNPNNVNDHQFNQKKGLIQQIEILKRKNLELEKKISQATIIKQKPNQKPDKKQLEETDQKNQKQKQVTQKHENIEENNSYEQDFESESVKIQKMVKTPKQLEEAKKNSPIDMQASEENEEILYKKEQKKDKKKKVNNKKKKTKVKTELEAIKQLLTYRLKGQRYPFEELKQDIIDSQQSNFKLQELQSMLLNSPFFLDERKAEIVLQSFFDMKKLDSKLSLTRQTLVDKLGNLIVHFELLDEKQQQEMYFRIAQMVTTYAADLQAAFDLKKNGQDTIKKQDLQDLFTQLELTKPFIELIISELSLVSEDLVHLNYFQFFKRFYLDEDEQVRQVDEEYQHSNSRTLNRNMIQQEQVEQSEESKRSKRKIEEKKKKNARNSAEFNNQYH